MIRFDRRSLLVGSAAAGIVAVGVPLCAQPKPGEALTPEAFGAKGDGRSNDTAAFQALGAWLAANGGTAEFRRGATYLVGANVPQGPSQTAQHSYTFLPSRILYIKGGRLPVTIRGNGATMRAAPGLRFGTFDRAGKATRHPLPWYGKDIAAGYYAMIELEDCHAPVEVSDLSLDGNMAGLDLGGGWGDAGYQLPGSGVVARNNLAPWRLTRVRAFHHALDGLMVDEGAPGAAGAGATDCDFFENGRQAASLVGGDRLSFTGSKFRRTRRGTRVNSPPGAGVDIEGEAKGVRDTSFTGCEFSDNGGAGLLAGEGRGGGARFTDCTFIGTTFWSAWPAQPGFVFDDCTFVGAVVNVYGNPDPAKATKFTGCRFTDDPALSPTGQVYGRDDGKPIVNLDAAENASFVRCMFDVSGKTVLPWSTRIVSYRDCTFRQTSPAIAYTRGTFDGTTTIDGQVTIGDSIIRGHFVRNGQLIAPGHY
jgi:hypothetical protein